MAFDDGSGAPSARRWCGAAGLMQLCCLMSMLPLSSGVLPQPLPLDFQTVGNIDSRQDIELPASGGLSFLKVGPSGDNIRSYTSCCGTLFNSAGGGNWAGGNFPARPLTRNNVKTADGGAYTPADAVTDATHAAKMA